MNFHQPARIFRLLIAGEMNPSTFWSDCMYAALFYLGLILLLHLIPSGSAANSYHVGPLRADHFVHILIFLPWMFFSVLSLAWRPGAAQGGNILRLGPLCLMPKDVSLRRYAGWMLLGLLLASGTESLHYLLSYRAFNPWDAIFNAAGLVAGGVVAVIMRGLRNRV